MQIARDANSFLSDGAVAHSFRGGGVIESRSDESRDDVGHRHVVDHHRAGEADDDAAVDEIAFYMRGDDGLAERETFPRRGRDERVVDWMRTVAVIFEHRRGARPVGRDERRGEFRTFARHREMLAARDREPHPRLFGLLPVNRREVGLQQIARGMKRVAHEALASRSAALRP